MLANQSGSLLKWVVVSDINSNMTYCNNCGHESHCGNRLIKDEIEVCKHCRCEKCETDIESETKYDME